MKTLINNIITFLGTAITDGDITKITSTDQIYKGFSSMPDIPLRCGYIVIDDGGEDIEETEALKTIRRNYNVIVEFGVYVLDRSTALDDILDFSDEVKNVFQLEANRQKDGLIWARSIDTFEVPAEDKTFLRIRQVTTQYFEIEDIYFDY